MFKIYKIYKMFKRLLSKKCILPEECKYFSYNFKKVTNLKKLYFLPKIHKRLYNVPGRPVISVVHLQKKCRNSWITTLNLLCVQQNLT